MRKEDDKEIYPKRWEKHVRGSDTIMWLLDLVKRS